PGIAEDQIHLGLFTAVMWALAFLVFPLRKATTWPAPTLADGAIALAIVVAIAGIALRADQTAEAGYQEIDWGLWLLAGGGALAALRRPRGFDVALLGLSLLCIGYYVYFYLDLIDRAGGWTPTDTVVAAASVLLALEAARRGIGPWITGIALFALLYAHFGAYFPEAIAHRGASVWQIVNYSFYSQEGIFGVMTTVMANYVLIFIYLGAFMHRSGMGQFFIDLPMALAGRTAGGPAKVAVAASAVFGSISGSTLANVVSTGALTIPLMKRVGFRPHVAGAVENSASLGGQLLPPVMGAGVFIMAEITGIPYVEIIGVAAVPALLYLFSIGLIVHFEARRRGIEGVRDSETDSARSVFRRGWFHLLPFCVLLGFLVSGYSPDWCAVMAIATTVLINWTRVGLARAGLAPMPRHILGPRGLRDTLVDGTTNALGIGAAAAGIGLIVGMMAMTGLGLKMSLIIVELSEGNLLIALFLVALASLVLGMALPITASYLVLVV
ncbi:MAG: TRAP transporter fused permease subunit, partial [Alphaproteobacteria bacterium]|nr:TRAP transporter fused permease subunit [Alphaproteobacteria bacterium]